MKIRARIKRIKKMKKSPSMEASAKIERRKTETLIERAKINNSKQFKDNGNKSGLIAFRDRCIVAEEQAQIKESEKNLDKNLTEIEKKKLEFISKIALSPPPKMIKLPDNFVDKPMDNEVSCRVPQLMSVLLTEFLSA